MADHHYPSVSLLLPMNGTNGGTTFTDWSPVLKTVTAYGNAGTSTVQSKYYGSSGYFDGAGDYLRIPYSPSFDPESSDFTVELWLRIEAYRTAYAHICGSYSFGSVDGGTANAGWQLGCSPTGQISFGWGNLSGVWTTVVNSGATSIGTGVFKHVALVKSGTTYTIYLDGENVGSATYSTSIAYTKSYFYVGSYNRSDTPFSSTITINGYMQDLRITKGVARYTSNFTPPSRFLGTISGTVLDDTGSSAERTVLCVPRGVPSKIQSTVSTSGSYSLTAPDAEYTVICLDDSAGTQYNALVYDYVGPA